jgi:hypothetical protein
MSSRTTFALLFFMNRDRIRRNGECPLYLRITINSKRLAIYTKRNIKFDIWDGSKGIALGNTKEAREINSFIEVYRAMVYNKYTNLLAEHEEVTLELLRDAVQGEQNSPRWAELKLEIQAKKSALQVEGRSATSRAEEFNRLNYLLEYRTALPAAEPETTSQKTTTTSELELEALALELELEFINF